MPDSLVTVTNVFRIEDDVVSLLRGQNDEELRPFEGSQETAVTDEQIEHHINISFLLFTKTRAKQHLEQAIHRAEEWIAAINTDHPDISRRLKIFDMMTAIMTQVALVAGDGAYDVDFHITNLCKRAVYLTKLHLSTGELKEIDEAISTMEQAEEMGREGQIRQPNVSSDLGVMLGMRFERTGSMHDLNRAVDAASQVIDTIPQGHHDRAGYLNNWGIWLGKRFERTGSMDDLNRAIDVAAQAVDATPRDHRDRAGYLNNLKISLGRRFERTGSMEDLDRVVKVAGQAVDVTPQDHPGRAGRLSNLGAWLGRRYEWTGLMDDLNRALEIAGQAVDATPKDHLNRAAYLNNLGNLLGRRFERTSLIDDVNRAVDITGQAIDATHRGHPDRAAMLNNLGNLLYWRFERTGSMDDLNRAVNVAGQAVDATPQDHPKRAGRLSNFGALLGRRSKLTGAIDDLNRAVDAASHAVDVTPQDHPDRAGRLSNLGALLDRRFELTGSIDDLNRAVGVARKAVDATTQDHHSQAVLLNNLGTLLGKRFEQTGSMDDLNRAIDVASQAVEATPRGHLDRAVWLNNHRILLGWRFEETGSRGDLNCQLSLCKEGWSHRTSAPSVRIQLARQGARILAAQLDWESSSEMLQGAVNLLPTISPRWLKHTDKQHMLADFAGLASTAASTLLNARKDAYDALRLLELGRGVIASLFMDMRGDISDLQQQHPDMANEFISLRDELDSPTDGSSRPTSIDDLYSWETRAQHHRETDEKLDKLISRIRAQPGFQNFLLPPTTDELMAAASLGPLIVINLSPYRCDAFLIETNQIQVLELPDLTLEGAQERAQKLRSGPQAATYHAAPLLEWLWDVVARPVLDALGFDGPIVDGNWPRVWWVPTGVLSQLPLHAAGYHTRSGHKTVIDRVMSSYASSVKALIHGRRFDVQRSVGTLPGNALLVGMRETPDIFANHALQFAMDEIEMLQNLCPLLGLRPIRPKPRKDDVLKHLQGCRIFHFAGHGLSDPDEPSHSCLLLEDWKTSPLTVGHLREHRVQDTLPFLGFLSACSTGVNKVDRLVDEGIHLVSAFQLAGFRHVVGTLWEVSDQHCVDVARMLYETMRDEGMTDVAVCRGLHRAIRALRDGGVGAGLMGREGSSAGIADLYDRTEVVEANTCEMPEDDTGMLTLTLEERDPGRVRKKGTDMSLLWIPYVHFGV